jgi:hypothetical protein
MVRRIFRQQTTAFKINLSFGFILRDVETGELRYCHSSQNNARFFETSHLIRTEEDFTGPGYDCWSPPLYGWYSSVLNIGHGSPGLLVIY